MSIQVKMEKNDENIESSNDEFSFDESISLLYESTCAKVNLMSHQRAEEEGDLMKSMKSIAITEETAESTDSKEEYNYDGSTNSNKNVKLESAESQESEYRESAESTELIEVTSERNGAKIIFATDDFYGVAENLLKDDDPVCNKHTIFSDNTDGWKTKKIRKHRKNFVIIELAGETNVTFICIDTACFIDFSFSAFSVQGGKMSEYIMKNKYLQSRKDKLGRSSDMREYTLMENNTLNWKYLIPKQELNPGYPSIRKKFFNIASSESVTHLRLNIFPDGGIARLHAYGEVVPRITPTNKEIDLISSLYYSYCILFSDSHIGHPNNIIQPSEATSTVDGWETARKLICEISRRLSFDKIYSENWAIFKLGLVGTVTRVVIDTRLFTGNAPYIVRVQGLLDEMPHNKSRWQNIISHAYIKPGTEQIITVKENCNFNINYVKIIIKPDGGISRLRIFGIPEGA